MHDSAPSHRAKATQDFLRNIVSNFISAKVLAPHSPDLNPLDYSVWGILQELVYEGRREPYANLHEPEKAIRQNGTSSRPTYKEGYFAVEKASSSEFFHLHVF